MELGTISRMDVSWLAGFIDGEGSIGAYLIQREKATLIKFPNVGKKLLVEVVICNTNPVPIKRVSEILQTLKIGFHFRTSQSSAFTKKWTIYLQVVGKGNCKKLLLAILPYLVAKKPEAEKLLELIAYRESLTYKGTNFKIEGTFTKIEDEPTILKFIEELKALKQPQYSPSETKRKANYPLQIKGLDY